MTRKRLRTLWPASILLGTLAACTGAEEPGTDDAPVVRTTVREIGLEPVARIYEASGTLGARQTAVVTSKVPGYVRELRVRAGDAVRAGQIVVVLDGEELKARLDAAKAGLSEAEQAEAAAVNGLAAADARAELAAATYARFEALEAKRAVTPQEMDEVRSRNDAAKAERDAQSAGLSRARAGLERARAEVVAAETMWEHTSVKAPFSGRVIERRADLGNLAMPGTPLLVVEQEGPPVAEVSVDEALSGRLSVGDEATVSLDGSGGAAEGATGTIHEIAPAVDPASRAFAVKVELPDTIDRATYAPGRFVRVGLRIGTDERLLVPESAVLRRGQLDFVYAVVGERARLRIVTIGRRQDGRVEVLSGLDPGDQVIVTHGDVPEEGARIEGRTSP